ncbi:hypothetical protein KCP74_11895 [Salmonella enterica subsp. enterica]|nr:hypothetical protein KCP74_11895 [Salmonella enterica subsp. enterica]
MIPPDEVTFIRPANLSPPFWYRYAVALRLSGLQAPVLQVWCSFHTVIPAKRLVSASRFFGMAA